MPLPSVGGLDLDSRSSCCARLGGGVGPPLGVVVEEVVVLVVLVRRHRHAVRAAVRRAVDDEVPGFVVVLGLRGKSLYLVLALPIYPRGSRKHPG